MVESELEYWVDRLVGEDMPLFTRTVQIVAGTASRDDSSFSDLAWSILQDPTLTAQVLKASNSMYYNPFAKHINTVSRGVMRLGFDTVKGMCLSIALVESVLSSLHSEKIALEVARAFHAAVQAKKVAIKRGVALPEEVFIAALLSRIGQIAFWSFAGPTGLKLEEAMKLAVREDEAEIEVLGFKLERLTLRLCQEWKLSKLLETMLLNKEASDLRVRSVRLGHAIAKASEGGWKSVQMCRVIREVCDFLSIPEEETMQMVNEAARSAVEITESYGAQRSSHLIPVPTELVGEASQETKVQYPGPDLQIQFSSLRDLSALFSKKQGDMNTVLSILLEGIYRGIGMDRVIFALLTPSRTILKGKYGLGWTDESHIDQFFFSAKPSKPNIFSYVLNELKPVWVSEDAKDDILSLVTKEMVNRLGNGAFFVMPIAITNKPIGVIYADRKLSGRDLDEESFDSFAFFGQQANMGLTALASLNPRE